jgi:hypothetical protein
LKRFIFLIVIILPKFILAQTINGKVYDAETTVKGALVVNVTQNIMTYTNDDGDFEIGAKVQDTLYISSLFHTKTFIEIKAQDFKHVVVIEVKKTINELDAVHLRDERERKFDSVKTASQLKNQIHEDLKNNPIQYQPPPSGNADFMAIFKMIGSLFKSKKPKEIPVIPITYKDLDSLFKKDSFFNNDLLTLDLNIPKDYQMLFFDYCDAKKIDSKLLAKNKQVDLLEELVISSKEFQKILEDSKKDN